MDAKKLDTSGDMPLGQLFRRGEHVHAKKLIALGANAAFSGEGGDGALHSVVERHGKEDLEVLRELLARPEVGAIVDRPCAKGQTALMRACFELNEKAIRELAAAGADVNARDAKGWTPLRHLLRKFGVKAMKKTEPILRLLVSLGADPAIADNEGLTPAQAASAKAPLGALASLFDARPGDLAGETEVSQAVRTQLEARGAAGQSLSEKVQLRALCEGDDAGEAPAPKRAKSRSI
jgi:ankyrin repeat protein